MSGDAAARARTVHTDAELKRLIGLVGLGAVSAICDQAKSGGCRRPAQIEPAKPLALGNKRSAFAVLLTCLSTGDVEKLKTAYRSIRREPFDWDRSWSRTFKTALIVLFEL